MNWPFPAAAIVERGARGVDAWHFAAVAVVAAGAGGRVTHAFGDPELTTFTRSAIKPFQALPLCLSGAVDTLGIDDEELALAASSHDGSDQHRQVAARLLAKAGADVADLQCGAHWPIGMRAADRHPTSGEDRDPLRHNCSGKHAGWLALARVLAVPRGRYLEADAGVQGAVRSAVAAACQLDEAALITGMITGTDGCSAPNYALPLSALARGMLNLATGGPDGDPVHAALGRVRAAMQAHPLLVSGPTRFDNQLAEAFGDRVVAKGGAEAVQAIGFSDPPLGIAVKILDGGDRALPPVCLEVLRQLGLWSGAPPPALAGRVRPVLRNHRGVETGAIVAAPALKLTALS